MLYMSPHWNQTCTGQPVHGSHHSQSPWVVQKKPNVSQEITVLSLLKLKGTYQTKTTTRDADVMTKDDLIVTPWYPPNAEVCLKAIRNFYNVHLILNTNNELKLAVFKHKHWCGVSISTGDLTNLQISQLIYKRQFFLIHHQIWHWKTILKSSLNKNESSTGQIGFWSNREDVGQKRCRKATIVAMVPPFTQDSNSFLAALDRFPTSEPYKNIKQFVWITAPVWGEQRGSVGHSCSSLSHCRPSAACI